MTEESRRARMADAPQVGAGPAIEDDRAESPSSAERWWAVAWRFALFFAAGASSTALAYPKIHDFSTFAFSDRGSIFAAEMLTAQGLRPWVDFWDSYGLLTFHAQSLILRLLGVSPSGFILAAYLSNALMCWAAARTASALRIGPSGALLMAVGLFYFLLHSNINVVYLLEGPLLAFALAGHARGRPSASLALLTACLFIKSTMSLIYGFLLTLILLGEVWRRRPNSAWGRVRPFLPAAVTGAAIAALLAATYGADALAESLAWPFLEGSKHYRQQGFGFFHGVGRNFLYPGAVRPAYYLGTITGAWVAATALLLAAALALPLSPPRGSPDRPGEVIACCALMHAAFVALFYAHAWSYWYYIYILMVGVAAIPTRFPRLIWAIRALVLVAALPVALRVRDEARQRHATAPRAELAGLWSDRPLAEEWLRVRRMARGRKAVLLSYKEGAQWFAPEFAPPQGVYYFRYQTNAPQLRRKLDQVADADLVVMPTPPSYQADFLGYWPEFAAALRRWPVAWEGRHFRVYARPGAPSA